MRKAYLSCPYCGSAEISLLDRVITKHPFTCRNCGRKYWIPHKVDTMRKAVQAIGIIPFIGLVAIKAAVFALYYGVLLFLLPFLVGLICAYIYPMEKVVDDSRLL